MSITHCPLPKARSNKHARHVHLNPSSLTKNSSALTSSPSRDQKGVILSQKKISRAKVQKMVNIHACWTRLRHFKIRKAKIRSIKQHQNRMKYRIISQQYLRKMSIQTRSDSVPKGRKIKWGDENEIMEFNKTESPENISCSNPYKEKFSVSF